MSRAREEDGIQRTLAQVLDLNDVLWCHVPNGGWRSPVEAAILKGLGVKPGVSDCLVFDPPPISKICTLCEQPSARGTIMELKTLTGRLTKDQKTWIKALLARGWVGGVAYGIDDALEKFRQLGYI